MQLTAAFTTLKLRFSHPIPAPDLKSMMLGYLAAFCVSSESPSSFTSSSKLTISSRSGTNLKQTLLILCTTVYVH